MDVKNTQQNYVSRYHFVKKLSFPPSEFIVLCTQKYPRLPQKLTLLPHSGAANWTNTNHLNVLSTAGDMDI
jgi:hypothetical protein